MLHGMAGNGTIYSFIYFLIHQVCPHCVLCPPCDVCTRVEEAAVLEDEHPTWFGFDVKTAVEVIRVESRGSSTAGVLIEVKMERIERDFFAIRSHIGAVLVRWKA